MKIYLIPFLILCLNCSTDEYNKQEKPESIETSIIHESYTLSVQIDELENENYLLSAKIDFVDSSYIISPFSEDSIFGKFDISIENNSDILLESSISES